MSHVDDGTLHELVDNALDAGARAAAEAHLASCGDCARRFAEATAMARQVQTLLGALDVLPAPLRIVTPTPARPVALASANVTAMPQRMRTLRRVALAASVLVVAGLGYRVGVGRTTGDVATARESAPAEARSARQPVAMPSRDQAAAESIARPSAPTVGSGPRSAPRSAPRGGPRAESEVAAGAASPAVGAMTAPMSAPLLAPAPLTAEPPTMAALPPASREQRKMAAESQVADAASDLTAARAVMKHTVGSLSGYQTVVDVALPSMTRRRYIAADGTTLVLAIAPITADEVKPDAAAAQEFTVSTAQGRSTVRWQLSGMSYVLQGALAPDSLMKLATQLK